MLTSVGFLKRKKYCILANKGKIQTMIRIAEKKKKGSAYKTSNSPKRMELSVHLFFFTLRY